MKIILNETETGAELQLEVNKTDTPAGAGWSVLTPQGRTVLIQLKGGSWQAVDDHSISQEFWQLVGEEISRMLEMPQSKAPVVVTTRRHVLL